MYDPVELPSLEEIKAIDAQRQQAVEALEIFDHSVKCQRCGNAVPIIHNPLVKQSSNSRTNSRIYTKQQRIKWIEQHRGSVYRRPGDNHDNDDNSHNNKNKTDVLTLVKEELAELLERDAKADKLRGLPLYSCAATRWKYVCGNCFEKTYRRYASSSNSRSRTFPSVGSLRIICIR